jgi:hypothetical protein
MPDTASLGTVHSAETDQLPQSIRPVVAWVRQFGWFWGRPAGRTVATLRAPMPP